MGHGPAEGLCQMKRPACGLPYEDLIHRSSWPDDAMITAAEEREEQSMTQEPDDGKTTAELATELAEATKMRERIERAVTSRSMLELVDSAISGAWAHAAGDIDPVDVRTEIACRLELINRYGGTEASHIKSILATGAPVDYETERAARRKLGDRAPQG